MFLCHRLSPPTTVSLSSFKFSKGPWPTAVDHGPGWRARLPSFLFFPPSHPFLAAALRALAAPGGRGAVASLRLRRDGRGARVGLCISETGLRRGRGASASPPRRPRARRTPPPARLCRRGSARRKVEATTTTPLWFIKHGPVRFQIFV